MIEGFLARLLLVVAAGSLVVAPAGDAQTAAPTDDDDPPVVRVQRPQPPTSPGGGHTTTPPTQSTARCPAGAAVVDRQDRPATVLGENNGLCVVRYADGAVHSTLHWLLSPAAAGAGKAPASGGGALPTGRYTCSMSSAGGQFPITIVDGSTYSDRGGQSGRYRVDGDRITFESGSLRGTFSRILGAGKFGLSTSQTTSFYGICNLKR